MNTDKASLLGITQRLPVLPSQIRTCTLEIDSIYGDFVKYSGEVREVKLDSSFIPDLLSLVRPFMPSDQPQIGGLKGPSKNDLQEHIALDVEHDPEEVIRFLNRWGMVGRISDLFESPMEGFEYPYPGLQFDDPNQSWEVKIASRETIPYRFVVDELIRMARCVRLVLRLLQGSPKKDDEFRFSVANRRRIISGWGFLPLEMPPEKDPATFRNLSEIWTKTINYKGKRVKYVELAETAISEFAQKMNSYLTPLSSKVLRTESMESSFAGKIGLETALATYLLDKLYRAGSPLQCAKCKNLYFPEKRKDDSQFCSQRCGQSVRQRRYRKKQSVINKPSEKVSASKAEEKNKTTRKGK
jgi:hypothetical protein